MVKSQAVIVFVIANLCACVQSHTMQANRALDGEMSCAETAVRMAELNAIKQLTLKEKNSKNIVASVLFFPAIGANQSNASQTINAVNERKKVLTSIYQKNECVNNIPVYSLEQIKVMIDKNQVRELQS